MNPPAPDVDVVVVGGGPAGSATAIWCARHGLHVALLERARFPRHRPGETLPPGVEPLLRQLGVADEVLAAGFLRHAGTWVHWEGAPRFEPFGVDADEPWLGFQAWRADFDALLLAAASGPGVRIIQPCRAISPIVNGSRVIGVNTSAGPLTAAWTIDATGGGHWLARKLGVSIQLASPQLIVHYGYATGACPHRDDAPAIIADPAGWTWTARVRPALYQWTRLALHPEEHPSDWLPGDLQGSTPHGRVRGADATWRLVTEPAGAGYVCVGDAAAVLDPAASHGVLKAIMSGMMAGHLIARAFGGTCSATSAAAAYRRWLAGWFAADVEALKSYYRTLPQPPNWA